MPELCRSSLEPLSGLGIKPAYIRKGRGTVGGFVIKKKTSRRTDREVRDLPADEPQEVQQDEHKADVHLMAPFSPHAGGEQAPLASQRPRVVAHGQDAVRGGKGVCGVEVVNERYGYNFCMARAEPPAGPN